MNNEGSTGVNDEESIGEVERKKMLMSPIKFTSRLAEGREKFVGKLQPFLK